ncbi:MAG: FG-GAP repeat protein [Phycisphaerales bacterium]
MIFCPGVVTLDGTADLACSRCELAKLLASDGVPYVFRSEGLMWIGQANRLPSVGASGDWFGLSIAIGGNVAVVGANGDDDNGPGRASSR